MIDEAKRCPFCGHKPKTNRLSDSVEAFCVNTCCPIYMQRCDYDDWNRRPLENAIRADLARVTAQRDALLADVRDGVGTGPRLLRAVADKLSDGDYNAKLLRDYADRIDAAIRAVEEA